MSHTEIIEKLALLTSTPIGVKNLSRKLDKPVKYIQWLLCNNPDKFSRVNPMEVGSGKWLPSTFTQKNCKGRINIWKSRPC